MILENEIVFIDGDRHLGDIMPFIIILNSRGINNGWKIDIMAGPSWLDELFEIFNFKGLNLISTQGDNFWHLTGATYSSVTSAFNFPEWAETPYLKQMIYFKKINRYANRDFTITLPEHKIKKEKSRTVFFQFDARSMYNGKIQLTQEEMNFYLKKYGSRGAEVFGIGGSETAKYLNHNFKLGNLRFISEQMLSCEKFIGSDSGMSILAGTLGVRGDVIITDIDHIKELTNFYNVMYPSLNVHFHGNVERSITLL